MLAEVLRQAFARVNTSMFEDGAEPDE